MPRRFLKNSPQLSWAPLLARRALYCRRQKTVKKPRFRYLQRAAPKSFIHVDDFASPQHLADYLIDLDRNETAYLEYLSWKFDYELRCSGRNAFCDLCQKLYRVQGTNVVSHVCIKCT
jgi:hypothetical protein